MRLNARSGGFAAARNLFRGETIMFMDQTTLVPDTSISVSRLRDECLGCKDCKGACLEYLQMHLMPEILRRQSEATQ